MQCHVASRIVQICDVFDALCTDRPYRAGLPPDVALAEVEAEAGSHFDPILVRQFAAMIRGSMLRFSSIEAERESGAGPGRTAAETPQTAAKNGDGFIDQRTAADVAEAAVRRHDDGADRPARPGHDAGLDDPVPGPDHDQPDPS
jgi:hypothetical protein